MDIIIIEDDAVARFILKKNLTDFGFNVIEFDNGEDAVREIIKKDKAQLIITDWVLEKMSGIEVCKLLKKQKKIPAHYVIFITSKDDGTNLVEAFDAGADDYIVKPFKPYELKARVMAGKTILELQFELEKKILERNIAQEEVKQLHGLINICSYCHKIRNDEEVWQQMELYIMKNSDAKFSHGICPVCMKTHHPEMK